MSTNSHQEAVGPDSFLFQIRYLYGSPSTDINFNFILIPLGDPYKETVCPLAITEIPIYPAIPYHISRLQFLSAQYVVDCCRIVCETGKCLRG